MADVQIHRPFVGRSAERQALGRWWSEASSGVPRVVTMSGAEGIGKSRLTAEWIGDVNRGEALVLVGHGHEHAEAPLLPILAALAPLGIGAGGARSDPSARVDATATTLLALRHEVTALAAHRPVLLVVNDFHWADPTTADFLVMLAATLAEPSTASGSGTRLLVLVTARPDPTDRLQQALHRIRREPIARRVDLAGLDDLSIHALAVATLGGPVEASLVRWLRTVSDGNPLLLELSLDWAANAGALRSDDGRFRLVDEHVAPPVGEQLDAVWSTRLGSLGAEARSVLLTAALLGDGESLELLETISEGLVTAPATAIDELVGAGALRYDGDHYRFRHPALRRAVESATSDRARRARSIAIVDRLSSGTERVDAVTLVSHALRAGRDRDDPWLLDQVERAGRECLALGAWGLSARHLDHVLDAHPSLGAGRRAELSLRAGQAHLRDAALSSAGPRLAEAADLAAEVRDLEILGESTFWATSVRVLRRDLEDGDTDALVTRFVELGDGQAGDHEATVWANVAQLHFAKFDLPAGEEAIGRAEAALRRAGRVGSHHFVATVTGNQRLGELDLDGSARAYERATSLAADHEDRWQSSWVDASAPMVDLLRGDLAGAERRTVGAVARALDAADWATYGLGNAVLAAARLARGEIDASASAAELAIRAYRRSDYFYAASIGIPQLSAARALRGDRDGALGALAEWGAAGSVFAHRHALRVEALAGSIDGIRTHLAESRLAALPGRPSLFTLGQATVMVDVGTRAGVLDMVDSGVRHLELAAERGVVFGLDVCVCVARVIAMGLVVLDRLDEAEVWLDAADTAIDSAGADLEAIWAALVRGRLRTALGDDPDAIAHALAPARQRAEALGLTTLSAELLRLAPEHHPNRRDGIVVLYTDLVGSTDLNQEIGDERFVELLREHDTLVRRRLDMFGGHEFTYTGDGVGAWFADPAAAARFAVGLQSEFDARFRAGAREHVHLRVGMAAGSAIVNEGNLFGSTVVRAVRTCAAAGAGEVLATADVAEELRGRTDLEITVFGDVSLKGFRGTYRLHRLRGTAGA